MAYGRIDAIAVTSGPGLAGALLVGVAAAKAYAAAWDVPLFGVNHLAGHVAADTLEHGPLPKPTLALLVSGGHTQLLRIDDLAGADHRDRHHRRRRRRRGLRQGRPPARARLSGRPGHRPAGRRPAIPAAVRFPRGLTGPRDSKYDFSFSGLKTSVARFVEGIERAGRHGSGRGHLRFLPGGGRRRADRQDRQGRSGSRDRHGGDRRRSGGQRPAAGVGAAAVRGRPG